jgi:hypothetical protein
MAILPKSILSEEIGIPLHPGPQPVFVGPTDEFPNLTSYGIESGLVGFPRMSPYRIYATPDSPPLYAQNNPPGIYFPVDFGTNKIGNAFADNAVRSFQVPAADTSNGQVIERFGTPIVADNRAVFVYPDRVRGRVGFAVLGGIDTEIKALWQTETSFGETSVVDLGPRTVRPGQSPITEEIGQAWASRDPEEILVPAMDFLQMPGLTQVNRPFLPFLVLGGVYDLHGNAFVSNSPQYIEGITAGFQQLILTDDINKRLRVVRRDRLPMSAGDVSQFGQSFVSFGVREIWASAPMRHRPAGPMVAIRATTTAEDSSEVGAISFG